MAIKTIKDLEEKLSANGNDLLWIQNEQDGIDNKITKENFLKDLDNSKVDKVEGKGLSTEDFTTEMMGKLVSLNSDYNNLINKPNTYIFNYSLIDDDSNKDNNISSIKNYILDKIESKKIILKTLNKDNEITYIEPNYISFSNDKLIMGFLQSVYDDDNKLITNKELTVNYLNDNYELAETINSIPLSSEVISKTNDIEYSPENDYNPATKKYVDDNMRNITYMKSGNLSELYKIECKVQKYTNYDTYNNTFNIDVGLVNITEISSLYDAIGLYSFALGKPLDSAETKAIMTSVVSNINNILTALGIPTAKNTTSSNVSIYTTRVGETLHLKYLCWSNTLMIHYSKASEGSFTSIEFSGNVAIIKAKTCPMDISKNDSLVTKQYVDDNDISTYIFTLYNNETIDQKQKNIEIIKSYMNDTNIEKQIILKANNIANTYFAVASTEYISNTSTLVITSNTMTHSGSNYLTSVSRKINYSNDNYNISEQIESIPYSSSVLIKGNDAEYIPTTDYSPATKKYVDEVSSKAYMFICGAVSETDEEKQQNIDTLNKYINDNNANKKLFIMFGSGDAQQRLLFQPFMCQYVNNKLYFSFYRYEDATTVINIYLKKITFENNNYVVESKSDTLPKASYLSQHLLTKYNTESYTPTNDYHPATKKYVDDKTPTLSTVATSGNYNDLSNKPDIPTTLPANGGNSDTVNGFSIWSGSKAEYDAITNKDSKTIYMIV